MTGKRIVGGVTEYRDESLVGMQRGVPDAGLPFQTVCGGPR